MRGVKLLLSGEYAKKKVKRCGINRKKVRAEGSKPIAVVQQTLGETVVSREGGNILAIWSMNRETPAIALA